MKPITFTLPLEATNSQNARKHWAVKAKDTKRERDRASLGLRTAEGFLEIHPLLRVTLTRVGPRQLDTDNLAGALKGVRDGVAARLRIDDGSPLIEWKYEQERGEYAVRVRIVEAGWDEWAAGEARALAGEAEYAERMRQIQEREDEAAYFEIDDFARPGRKAGGE